MSYSQCISDSVSSRTNKRGFSEVFVNSSPPVSKQQIGVTLGQRPALVINSLFHCSAPPSLLLLLIRRREPRLLITVSKMKLEESKGGRAARVGLAACYNVITVVRRCQLDQH